MSFDNKNIEVPKQLPMLPVRDIVVFPHMILPLFVGRESSIKAVENALKSKRLIFLASQKDYSEENPSEKSIYTTGTVAMIMRMRKLGDGRVKILIQGLGKATITEYLKNQEHFEVAIKTISEPTVIETPDAKTKKLVSEARNYLEKIIALGGSLSPDLLLILDDINDPGRLADLIAYHLNLKVSDSQQILEEPDRQKRLNLVIKLLKLELEVVQAQAKFRNENKMSQNRNDNNLKDQMKAIKNELDDQDSKTEEFNEIRQKINDAGMPADAEKEAHKQLSRLERMHPDASEASMVRNYLEWLVAIPWSQESKDSLDLNEAEKILENDHYGLEKAKERVMEFLAVRKLKSDLKGPILCFCGPPGVGKTSLGKSIAKAMGREYHRIALGGVKDEAEIRGHRRTYVGAMPGKIIQALKATKTKNPVIVLDEIDKLGSDFRGDPSAAMLEVLDPEQNSAFRDNFINLDFDLSNVLFIATANVLGNIPAALRDRMELIQISGYTENDKHLIAKNHLVKRRIIGNGLTDSQVKFTDVGIKYLIAHYTREAGVRNLEREIGSVCRKIAKKVVMEKVDQVTVNDKMVAKLLGAPRFIREEGLKEDTIGIVTGLAWTQAGGETLLVEALKMKGKGVILTGQMGDVMKESATAAMSYARAHSKELGIKDDWFAKHQIHIHLPAGAIPKDGPSAGITMATSIISLMTDTPVKKDIAMTGEVTLAGRVLPVGGIKEKCLAALNAGIKTVIIPFQNQKDAEEIPKQLKQDLQFIFVEHLDEVLQVALVHEAKGKNLKDDKTDEAAVAA